MLVKFLHFLLVMIIVNCALVDTTAISYNHMYIYCHTAMPLIHILLLYRKPLSMTKNNQYQGSSIRFTQRQ